ncbi:hypothetical protein DEU56DRAFT_789354 [Suillus clintonianus]|uniref:uncharacterized protein n=1 Tax=Suillus clintonianus TaxID=1904413 RepID=UPI001B85C72E|nr:uncharacterized protein DEU56DRAFT_789354 [Suillus clintonianus]KAG2145197.1 hypothetical protein DEU56DRAFT_789354 [Suillus clintonianus]
MSLASVISVVLVSSFQALTGLDSQRLPPDPNLRLEIWNPMHEFSKLHTSMCLGCSIHDARIGALSFLESVN